MSATEQQALEDFETDIIQKQLEKLRIPKTIGIPLTNVWLSYATSQLCHTATEHVFLRVYVFERL